MKQKRSGKKYMAIGLLLALLMVTVAGCTNQGSAGGIDPNTIEHNPNQPVTSFSGGEKDSSITDKADETLPGLPDSVGTTDSATGKPEENGADSGNAEENTQQTGTETAEPVTCEYVVVLDPGHGGAFTGAIYGLVEKEVVLKIANYAKEYLQKNYPQLEVKMTRETDKDFDTQLAKDLENRVQLGKEMGADVFVSFHLNASAAHNIQGAEVICPHRENVKEDSFLLANCILDELTALGIKRRGIVTKNSNDTVDANGNPVEYYAINRHAANRDMIGIIVEHCFMDNEADKAFLADEEALKRLGEADARGIAAYFGY